MLLGQDTPQIQRDRRAGRAAVRLARAQLSGACESEELANTSLTETAANMGKLRADGCGWHENHGRIGRLEVRTATVLHSFFGRGRFCAV